VAFSRRTHLSIKFRKYELKFEFDGKLLAIKTMGRSYSKLPNPVSNDQSADWWAISAGLFCSLATFSILIILGTLIIPDLSCCGLNVTTTLSLLFTIFVEATSIFIGAYTAARFSITSEPMLPSEARSRNGWHGLAVWGTYYFIGALIANWITVGGILGLVNNPASSAITYDIVDDTPREESRAANQYEAPTKEPQRTVLTDQVTSKRFLSLVKFITLITFILNGLIAWHGAILGGKSTQKT
jgi:hypothetical protein